MNKFYKSTLAVLGGIEATVYIFTPIVLITIWDSVSKFSAKTLYLLYFIFFLATLFRAIKIGWGKFI